MSTPSRPRSELSHPRVPQADLLTFGPTLLLLPVVFLGGYFAFVTVWVPRLLATFKARAWLTRYAAATAGAAVVADPSGWPELFLLGVQFAGLAWVVTRVGLVPHEAPRLATPAVPTRVTPVVAATTGVENFFLLWGQHRSGFLYAPAAGALTRAVSTALEGFGFFAPAKQFPRLRVTLKEKLTLSEGTSDRVG